MLLFFIKWDKLFLFEIGIMLKKRNESYCCCCCADGKMRCCNGRTRSMMFKAINRCVRFWYLFVSRVRSFTGFIHDSTFKSEIIIRKREKIGRYFSVDPHSCEISFFLRTSGGASATETLNKNSCCLMTKNHGTSIILNENIHQ